MKKIILLPIGLLMFSACSTQVKNSKHISEIDIKMDGKTISVDSNLNYKYYGDSTAQLKGYYTGKAPHKYWDSLIIKVDSLGTASFFGSNCINTDPGAILLLKKPKADDWFIGIKTCLPAKTKSLMNWIANSYKNINLSRSKNALKFKLGTAKDSSK